MATAAPAKKAKVGEEEEEKDPNKEEEAAESKEESDPPFEEEGDAPVDISPKIKVPVVFHPEDTTMNCMPGAFGNIFMPLSDGGFQYLLAGARASVGIKSGRYMFEVKVLELLNPAEDPNARQRTPMPRNQLRVGFSTQGASLFLGEAEEMSLCFDIEGNFTCEKKKKEGVSQKITAGDTVAVVLNLDNKSKNSNTVSIFKNGERAGKPQQLPEALKGKALFPAVTFKNLTLHYNFGPTPLLPLPFTCRMIKDISVKDATIVPAAEKSKDGKNEVIFPVCVPDEGGFDWLDSFLEKNKHFMELSDRAILSWAEHSGLWRPSGYTTKSSNDRPEMGFGISMMDDGSVRRVLHAVAPAQQRSYVVMEVKANLLKEDRRELLTKWSGSGFKRVAAVMVGEPPPALKKRCQELTLKAKQEQAEVDFKKKTEEYERKKLLQKRQRQLERERRKAEKAAKRKQEELKRKAEAEAKVAAGEPAEEPPQEEKAEESEEEEKEDEEEEVVGEEAPQFPKVELSPEEKKQWFRKTATPDLSTYALNASFMNFSLPEKDKEDFDEIRQEWFKGDKCKDYLKQWVRDRKLTTRIEDLQPGEWFIGRWKEWQKTVQAWHGKQNQYKAAVAQKAAEAAAKAAAKEAKKKAAAEKQAAEAKAKEAKEKAEAEKAATEKESGEVKEGGEEKEAAMEEKPKPDEAKENEDEEKKAEEEEEEEGREPEPVVDFDCLDVFGVEDILDVGGGQPLFSAFAFEDWTMMSLRYELHLLAHAFKRDVNDPERIGIHIDHLEFYYLKYYKKALNMKFYGVETVRELLEHIRDSVVISGKNQVIETLLPDDMESLGLFIMLTEESRRNRILRIDLGEESAKLKFSQPQDAAKLKLAQTASAATAASVAALRPGVQTTGALRPSVVPGRPVGPTGTIGWTRPVSTGTVFPASGAVGSAFRPPVTTFQRPAAMGFQPQVRQFTPSWRAFGGR